VGSISERRAAGIGNGEGRGGEGRGNAESGACRFADPRFYLNQVRKDQELTEKIEWFKAKRDELVRESPMEQLAADADRIVSPGTPPIAPKWLPGRSRQLLEVEATRDMSQTIVHCDCDAFFGACEEKRDPSLKGKAFGVGKGVLTTASVSWVIWGG
jgi:DNA polymerase kappa